MTEQRIGMRQAVDAALATLQELYPDAPLEDLLLEEVFSLEGDEDRWEVTVGFARPYVTGRPSGAISSTFTRERPRAYKRFIVDASTGEVRGMLDGRIDID